MTPDGAKTLDGMVERYKQGLQDGRNLYRPQFLDFGTTNEGTCEVMKQKI